VHTPTLIGCGPRGNEGGPATNLTTHINEIVALIEEDGSPGVVLVGHSYGGLPTTGVAATIGDRIDELIYVDPLLVPPGKRACDVLPAALVERQRARMRDEGDGWRLPPMTLEDVGGIGAVEAGVDRAQVERLLAERRGTHPVGTLEEPVWWDDAALAMVQTRYVIGTDKPGPNGEYSRAHVTELREAGVEVDGLPTGHFPMLTMPTTFTAVLTRHAAETR
jgi:pimeloyl-ACP methyl ester carboxylesterase